MGFVTNQWIKDLGRRRARDYVPVEASIEAVEDRDDWAAENGVLLEIQATRANGDYQSIHLTSGELDSVLRAVVRGANRAARRSLAMDLLVNSTDAEFVGLFAKAMERRLAQGVKRDTGNG